MQKLIAKFQDLVIKVLYQTLNIKQSFINGDFFRLIFKL